MPSLPPLDDERWLLEALAAARPWRGRVAPNPAVGAVVVRNGQLLATGKHTGPGNPHAEPDALDRAGDARGATLYVTLEPCNHHGRTPPCTERILAAGVSRVVFAHGDRNPRVAGRGAERLRAAGIVVEEKPLEAIDTFYRSFDRASLERQPTATAKLAVDRHGRYAGAGTERYAITGAEAALATHRFRNRHDALLTTWATVNADDPRLDVRLPDESVRPLPVYVWDREARLALDRRLFRTARSVTVFHGPNAPEARLDALKSRGARLWALPEADPWREAMTRVVDDGHHHLWVEAGGRFLEALAETSYLQRLVLYLGARPNTVAEGPCFPLPTALGGAGGGSWASRLSVIGRLPLGADTAWTFHAPGDEPPVCDLDVQDGSPKTS